MRHCVYNGMNSIYADKGRKDYKGIEGLVKIAAWLNQYFFSHALKLEQITP